MLNPGRIHREAVIDEKIVTKCGTIKKRRKRS